MYRLALLTVAVTVVGSVVMPDNVQLYIRMYCTSHVPLAPLYNPEHTYPS